MISTTAHRPSGQLAGVQILRALAALMVVMHHALHETLGPSGSALAGKGSGFPWMAGVDIFFVVSGFIMVHASAGLFGQPQAARTFLLRRLVRIVPLYWLVTTVFLVVVAFRSDVLNTLPAGWHEVVASYFFWPMQRVDGNIQPVFSLGWTLNHEMQFYLLFAAALLLRQSAKMTVAIVTCVLVLLVIRTMSGTQSVALTFWGSPIVLEFAIGMAIGLVRAQGWRMGILSRLFLAILGLLLLVMQTVLPGSAMQVLLLSGLAATCLVAAAALGRPSETPDMPGRGWLVALGDASYALYLTHPFVLRGLRFLLGGMGLAGTVLAIVLMLLAASLAALVIHRWFERPLARRAGKMASGL